MFLVENVDVEEFKQGLNYPFGEIIVYAYLFMVPTLTINLIFIHLMMKFKRVEIMINPEYTLKD